MLNRSRFRFAIAVIAALFALNQPASQLAQQQTPQQKQETKQPDAQTPTQETSVRISTQLVQIDATVTDKKGEHVEDLTEGDFELTVDGKKQSITYFRLVKLPEPKRLEPAVKPVAPSPSAPMGTIAPEQVARTIAFVVDDLGLSFESAYYTRRALKKFLDEQMQEGDLVAIIRTGRGLGALQQFTSDKRVLYAAVEKVLKLEIFTFTFNENGIVVEQHGRAFELRVDEASHRLALRKGFDYTDDFVIKKPGAYQFRAVIRDVETGRMGSAGQFIQVPDLSKNRLALSGLVLGSSGTESDQQSTKSEGHDDIQSTPNVRRFSRDGVIDYGAFAFNPTLDPKTGKPQLTMHLEIYRDGKVIYQLEPRPVDPGEAANPKRLECGGRLKLKSFPPGEYLMRMAVTDQLAKQKYSRAEQWMDFSVR